jgi:creatinine amidohydrolase
MAGRHFVLKEATYQQLQAYQPNVAVLPWGATEAHNYHLSHGVDFLQAEAIAERGAELAVAQEGRPVVLPSIPYGNDAQQLDQAATIHLGTSSALALLRDVVHSLKQQGFDRLVILNGHGGNHFGPLVRDLQHETGMLIVVADFFHMRPEVAEALFERPGDHADELETSVILQIRPDLVALDEAGPGEKRAFDLAKLRQPGVWTPRPWAYVHPDTGCGDPSAATAEKGQRLIEAVAEALAEVLVELSRARKGQVPYV